MRSTFYQNSSVPQLILTSQVPASDFASRKPLVDYAGVTPSLLKEFGTGAPFPYNDLATRAVKMR